MNFKTTDALFNKIKEDLYSYDAAGLLDEGKFYKDVQYVLASLGVMWYRDAEEMLQVDGYRANLPKDFNTLEAIYKCTTCGEPRTLPPGIVFHQLTFDHYPETQIPDWHVAPHCGPCGTATCCPVGYKYNSNSQMCNWTQTHQQKPPVAPAQCDPCPDLWSQDPSQIFNRHEVLLIQRGNTLYTYGPPTLMKAGNVNTRKMCTDRCPNIYNESQDTFTIQNGKIYTNFKDGGMMMLYKAFPLDEETGLPMIPDNVLIEKAIEDYIKYNIIKNLRTNGDANVAQLLPLYQHDMDLSMGKAITETKTPSFATMVHNVRLVRKRLNVYQFPHMGGR